MVAFVFCNKLHYTHWLCFSFIFTVMPNAVILVQFHAQNNAQCYCIVPPGMPINIYRSSLIHVFSSKMQERYIYTNIVESAK